MAWTNSDVRRLLRYLDSARLEDELLGRELKIALGRCSAREAVLTILEQSFDFSDPYSSQLYKSVVLRDLQGFKTRQIAHDMHLSNRQYFRYRAAAIEAIARTADLVLKRHVAAQPNEAKLATLVSRVDPDAALKLYETALPNPTGKLAFDLLCTTLRANKPVRQELIDRCDGVWRLLALTAIGRKYITDGQPQSSEPWRRRVQLLLKRAAGSRYEDANFELAYMDRLEAVRRCDMKAARAAAQRMLECSTRNELLRGLALVAHAEQACDDGELEHAERLLRQLEGLHGANPDVRVLARGAHAKAVLHFVRQKYDAALSLANGAAAALVHLEPGFALCAHANAGRAALQSGQSWKPPANLCKRYPIVWITGHIHAVHARHLLDRDLDSAVQAANMAVAIAQEQNATGALLYARATRGMVSYALHRQREAVHDWIESWEGSLNLARWSYLCDLLVHPCLGLSISIATLADELFITAAQRRFATLLGQWPASAESEIPVDAIRIAAQLTLRRLRAVGATGVDKGVALATAVVPDDNAWAAASPTDRLAADIGLLLPFEQRQAFSLEFAANLRRASAFAQSRSTAS